MSENITINSRKLDYSIQRSWQCELVEETFVYWLFLGKFESEIKHSELGIIRRGTISYEYYFKDKWFNVFRFHEPEGDLKYYYCNINMPPIFENNMVDYVDLDIDILVQKDFSFKILDEDEFEINSQKLAYSEELKLNVKRSIKDLIELIEKRQFPFDGNLQS
jgi:uncharacterized protein